MDRRRICYLGWADHVHTERWAGYFAQQGDEVSLISTSGLGNYPPGTVQHALGMDSRGPRWKAWRLRWLLWRLRPQLLHVHWAHFAVLARMAWRGPTVVTAWGSDVYRDRNFTELEWTSLGQALRASALVTCDSEDLADTLRQKFELRAEQVAVIQWGVDTASFNPNGENLRASLGLQGREVILSPRNFTPLYNQETIVRAFARLHRERPQTVLLMKNYGGDEDYIQRILAVIDELGLRDVVQVLQTLRYEEMAALYRTADVMVSVPLSDATPMSLLEAMACGCACVVCDLPSLREWVTHERTGLLVQAQDVEALHQAMLSALSSTAAPMRAAARAKVVEQASQHAWMARMSAHYDTLIAR